jgi:HD-like signal output (HDOD) protein
MLLKAWSFPDELVAVPVALENLQRETGATKADYADVVTIASLLNQPPSKAVAWDSVFALKRLVMSPEECAQFHERFGNQVRTTRELLSGD